MLLQMSLCGAQEITLGSMRTLRNISIPTVRELPAHAVDQHNLINVYKNHKPGEKIEG